MNLRHKLSGFHRIQTAFFVVVFLAGFIGITSWAQKKESGGAVSPHARRIHEQAILIDTHSDTTSATVDGFDIATQDSKQMEDIGKLRAGNVGAQFFAAYVAARYTKTNQSAHRALEMIDTIRFDIVGKHPETFELATTAADIERIHRQGKIAALIGIEGGHAIEDSLRLLRDFHSLGVRYMTLTHTNTNNWADSSGDMDKADVKHHNGLTDFGREVVHEMNRLGMMVDVSHVSDKTFYDVIATTQAPVIASHSSCRAISNVPRNMTDDMIKALAKNKGVIQINYACEFLSQQSADEGVKRWAAMEALQEKFKEDPEKLKAEQKKLMDEYQKTVHRATLDDVVSHIDHVKKLAGIDYVGLGSDFDGITCVPDGLEDASKLPALTQALLNKGYTEEEIKKLLGGNTLRLMRAVEKAAEPGDSRRLMGVSEKSSDGTESSGPPYRAGRDGVSHLHCVENCSLRPSYTDAARKRKINGTVLVEFTVRVDGSTDRFKVLRGIGYGLDENAVAAIRQWKFRPGYKDGQPVDVIATAEISFSLF